MFTSNPLQQAAMLYNKGHPFKQTALKGVPEQVRRLAPLLWLVEDAVCAQPATRPVADPHPFHAPEVTRVFFRGCEVGRHREY